MLDCRSVGFGVLKPQAHVLLDPHHFLVLGCGCCVWGLWANLMLLGLPLDLSQGRAACGRL